jgi:hypothetical protein
MAETLTLRGELKAHRGWVTAVAPPLDPSSDVLLSSSRCVLIWLEWIMRDMICCHVVDVCVRGSSSLPVPDRFALTAAHTAETGRSVLLNLWGCMWFKYCERKR